MYHDFAYVYDRLMADVPYKKWVDYYEKLFRLHQVSPHLVLDLGCGTGSITSLLQNRGYEMIGVDRSPEMLSIAADKLPGTLFLNQDMTDFELYGTVDAVVSALDSVNYIVDSDRLLRCFSLVRNYLNPGGLFVFDINSAYKLRSKLGRHSFVEETEDIFYVWENEFDEKSHICSFFLNLFVQQEDGRYERIEESQAERAYEVDEVNMLLQQAGLMVKGIYGQFTVQPPKERSERIFFVAQRPIQ